MTLFLDSQLRSATIRACTVCFLRLPFVRLAERDTSQMESHHPAPPSPPSHCFFGTVLGIMGNSSCWGVLDVELWSPYFAIPVADPIRA